MVEPILYASLGALLATLLGLMFLPFFWRRAVRLTTRDLVRRLPVSASEIVASHDRLRAEQAMTMRSVERKAERAMSEATLDRIESARARSTELQHLADLAELRAKVEALESEGARIRVERDRHGAEAASAYDALAQARAAAEVSARETQAARQDASAARVEAEAARNEASARQSEIAMLRQKLEATASSEATAPPLAAAGTAALSASAPEAAALAAAAPATAKPAPRMPKAELAFPAAAPDAPNELAALRARLDEVADAIVAASEPDRKGPAPARASKRMRIFSAHQLNEGADA